MKAFISVSLLLLTGCATTPAPFPTETPVELTGTPFFPQREHHCGPAALATVLVASGIATEPDDIAGQVYLPGRKGSLQLELVAATRAYDRLAYRIEPSIEDLARQVSSGRPVLVLQNLALKRLPRWHYAVVIGFDPQGRSILLRSGTTERLRMSMRRFDRSWSLAGRWGIVLLEPGEMPVNAQPQPYLEAAAGLESAGRFEAALKAYRAALAQWPGNATAMLGIGNVHYRKGELRAAEGAFRELTERHPGHAIAHNNLAQVLLELNEPKAALEQIRRARAVLDDPRFAEAIEATEAEILRALGMMAE